MINGRGICHKTQCLLLLPFFSLDYKRVFGFPKSLASVVQLLVVIKHGIANPSTFLFVPRVVIIKGLKSLVARI